MPTAPPIPPTEESEGDQVEHQEGLSQVQGGSSPPNIREKIQLCARHMGPTPWERSLQVSGPKASTHQLHRNPLGDM